MRPIRSTALALDVVIPVYNEEVDLRPRVSPAARLPERAGPADASGSPSRTTPPPTAPRRSPTGWRPSSPEVRAVHLAEKGRGRALKQVWSDSDADVLAYMDVDLSTDLDALLPLVAPLLSGHSDLAIGTRLHRGSRVVRGPKREFISRCYNLILRGTLAARFSDAQCGFKAIRRRRRAAAAAAGPGHRLVLRHRAAGAGRARRAAHPRGAGGLGRRPGLPGRHRQHRHGRPARRVRGSAGRWPPARCRSPRCAGSSAGPPLEPGTPGVPDRPDPADRPVRRHRRRQHAGLSGAVPAAPRPWRARRRRTSWRWR